MNLSLANAWQLPCRSAEVKFLSVFLCQRCREIWREILVKFTALRFPGFRCATENFTKISRQKRRERTQISLCWGAAALMRWQAPSRASLPVTHSQHCDPQRLSPSSCSQSPDALALFRSLCNKRQLSRKNKFDKLSGMFPALVFVAL